MTTGTLSLPVFESGSTPPTDPQNGQFYDLSGVPYFVNASGVASSLIPTASAARAYYGDGSDGAATFNGSGAVTGATLAGGNYTLTRDVFYSSATISTGVAVTTAGYRFFCSGSLTLTGTATIFNNGSNASGATGGAGAGEAVIGGATANPGATAPGGASTNGNASTAMASAAYGGAGGAGGNSNTKTGGAGGTVTPVSGASPRHVPDASIGCVLKYGTFYSVQGGTGGGSGATGSTGVAGGGGGGGGVVMVACQELLGSGSIEAGGGQGGAGTLNSGSGGGGGGGCVILVYGSSPGFSGGLTANGGPGGTGGHANGSNGSNGTVIEIQG